MVKKGLTEIVCVIDRSGSMAATASEVRAGFAAFLKEQKETAGDAKITVITFDTMLYKLLHTAPLSEVKDDFLTEENYYARGWTALLDAIGATINNVGNRLKDMPEDERPEKVIFLVMTDGGENCSREYTSRQRIKEMVQHQTEKYNWEFMFVGANVDVFGEASSLGFSLNNAAYYNQARVGGTSDAFGRLSRSVTRYRTLGTTGGIDSEDVDGKVVASADKADLVKTPADKS